MKTNIGRIVALITPIAASGTAVGTAWLGRHFPGLPAPSNASLVALEVTGASAVVAAALKWLHGLSAWERLERTIEAGVQPALKAVETVDPSLVGTAETDVKTEIAKVAADIAPVAAWPAPALAAVPSQPPAVAPVAPTTPPTAA